MALDSACYVVYKYAYLRFSSLIFFSLIGRIPPDSITNALSSPGIMSFDELPQAYLMSLYSRSCNTSCVR